MLTVESLAVRYGPIAAVRDVSLRIDEGEVVGIIGPNGAGKTTALSAIFGLVRPASGTMTFEGTSLIGLQPEAVVRRGIALVPEGRHIFGTLTVEENLLLGTTPAPDRRAFRNDLGGIFKRFPILKEYMPLACRPSLGRRAAATRDRARTSVSATAAPARRAIARARTSYSSI